ncbi:glucan endo-1,3-beta-glucosidase 8-like [Bidens hawaiensis]|uniref:glucan endo-1,3-beta-glucosidase 8-like n=1 Tax=Bidens hawaiensis TaxID=980011 RepID=UPI0040491BB1
MVMLITIIVVVVVVVVIIISSIGIIIVIALMDPKTVVQMMKDNGINKVKLFDAEQTTMSALSGSGIEVMIAIPNDQLAALNDYSRAKKNVTRYNFDGGVNIKSVAVGNEPFLVDYKDKYINSTLPALQNIQKALDDAELGDKIKASVPFSGDVCLSPPWRPLPSAGLLRPDVSDQVEDIADFLAKNNAPFIINIYPFYSLALDDGDFPMDYAFFDGNDTLQDGDLEYTNVFDASYDTCVSALKQIGHGNMTIVVGEIGWPTDGYKWANNSLSTRFYKGLLPRLAAKKGTPLRPGYIEVYLFGLMDEDTKSLLPGDFGRHWGIFDYAGQPKLNISLGGKENKTLVGVKDVKFQPKKWCVLRTDVPHDGKKLNESTSYACDRADCSALADGGSCTALSDCEKASYAFNSYFQASNQSRASCDFGGLATQTDQDPSKDQCKFNIQIKSYGEEPSNLDSEAPAPAPTSSSHFTRAPPVATIGLALSVVTSLFCF